MRLSAVLFAALILSSLAGGPVLAQTPVTAPDTMTVRGRFLYSAAGERVILRGVNEMMVWSADPTGERILPEIARTGANAVRIVTTPAFSAHDLDAVLGNAIANGMIPIAECHAATGKWDKLPECVAYWTRSDIVSVIRAHQRWVLVNIANEAGDQVAAADFLLGYQDAISRIRGAGVEVPLVIDGSEWGREYAMLLDSWAPLNAFDPRHAIVVSAHSYWIGTEDERKAPYRLIIERVMRHQIPFLLGEGPTPSGWDCQESPYQWAMTELDRAEIGWLAWSWGAVRNGDCREQNGFDITEDGQFGRWRSEAGEMLMVGHPASITATSRRPCSIANAGANCVRPESDGDGQ